jgi:hypothetical protein
MQFARRDSAAVFAGISEAHGPGERNRAFGTAFIVVCARRRATLNEFTPKLSASSSALMAAIRVAIGLPAPKESEVRKLLASFDQ